MTHFAIVIESGSRNFSAFAPDLPGYVASMIADGDPLPAYDSFGETIAIEIVTLPTPRE